MQIAGEGEMEKRRLEKFLECGKSDCQVKETHKMLDASLVAIFLSLIVSYFKQRLSKVSRPTKGYKSVYISRSLLFIISNTKSRVIF